MVKKRRVTSVLTWPDDTCSTSPTLAHHMLEVEKVDGGILFCCKYCQCYKWLPVWYDSGATGFSADIHHYGIQAAYQKLLSEHPTVVRVLQRYEVPGSGKDKGTSDSDAGTKGKG